MYAFIQKFLFLFDAETSHRLALKLLNFTYKIGLIRFFFRKPVVDETVFLDMTFSNKVGLAAGLDKNGEYIDALSSLGFGFIEIGTVTPRPQPGNDCPRLFRIKEKQAIINRMGFNNKGIDYLIENVKRSGYTGVLGINIGKNIDTPVENAVDDYLICLEKAYDYAHYITINISSPNTPGLRNLQHGDALDQLLGPLKSKQQELSDKSGRYVPLMVKIAPDLTNEEIADLAMTFIKHKIDSVIATNTTFSRDGVAGLNHADEAGGLSGKPLNEMSTKVLSELVKQLDGEIPVIGVGGISCGDDAREKLNAGATLVQVYSGFIYQGPELIYQCARALKQ